MKRTKVSRMRIVSLRRTLCELAGAVLLGLLMGIPAVLVVLCQR